MKKCLIVMVLVVMFGFVTSLKASVNEVVEMRFFGEQRDIKYKIFSEYLRECADNHLGTGGSFARFVKNKLSKALAILTLLGLGLCLNPSTRKGEIIGVGGCGCSGLWGLFAL
jgi:hypothetical protein